MKNVLPLFPGGYSPQQRYRYKDVARSIRNGSVTTWQVMWLLLQLRDLGISSTLREWGNNIAHTTRDRGYIWDKSVRIWATQVFFRHLRTKDTGYLTLPVQIYETIISFIEESDQRELDQILKYDLDVAYSKNEILQTFRHAYHRPKGKDYVTAISENILMKDDPIIIDRFIDACETRVLSVPPIELFNIVGDIQTVLMQVGALRAALNDEECDHLQAHILAAFHQTTVDLSLKGYTEMLGLELELPAPMLSLAFLEKGIALELGFYFRNSDGKLESEPLIPETLHLGSLYPTYAIPLMISTLDPQKWVYEDNAAMRWEVFQHPVEVQGRKLVIKRR